MATNTFSVTTSRAVRSAMNASVEAGRTARTRAVASRAVATFAARSALSTTGRGGAQDPRGTPLLDRLEVEVVEQDPRLAGDQRAVVALDEQPSVAEDAVGEGRGRLVQRHEVDGAPGGGLQACGQVAQRAHVTRHVGGQLDGDVGVTVRMCTPTGAGAEEHGISDTALGFEDATKRVSSRSAGDRATPEPLRVGEAWRHERRRVGSHRRGSLERLALGDGENFGDVVEAPDQAAADLDRGGAIGDP